MPQSPPTGSASPAVGAQELPPQLLQLLQQYFSGSQGNTFQAGLGVQTSALEGQLPLNQATTASQIGETSQQAGLQQAGLALSGQGIGIQQQGLAAESGLSSYQQGIETQQYGLSQQNLQQQLGQLATGRTEALQGMQTNAAASGVAGGHSSGTAQYGAATGDQQQLQALQKQYGYNVEDVKREIAQGAIGQKSEVAGYQYSQGDLARQQEQLGLAAQQNGLSEDEVTSRLNYGIQQLGLQGSITAADIMQQLGSTEAGGAGSLMSILGPLAQITGLGFGPTGSS